MHERATVAGTHLIVDPPRHAAFSCSFERNATIPSRFQRVDITLTRTATPPWSGSVHIGLPTPLAPTTGAVPATTASLPARPHPACDYERHGVR